MMPDIPAVSSPRKRASEWDRSLAETEEQLMRITRSIDRRRRPSRRLPVAGALVGAALLVAGGSASGSARCFQVRGHYDERAEAQDCSSGVGLCISGEYHGSVGGSFFTTVTSITPTADTTVTNVLSFTADSVIEASVKGHDGDLEIKNAGAFESTGDGNIVDLQLVTGGTGDLTGATGTLRSSGLFDPATGSGSSRYEGEICLPESAR